MPGCQARWKSRNDFVLEPFRPELGLEVAYDTSGDRFRHMAQFRRCVLYNAPQDCTYAQREVFHHGADAIFAGALSFLGVPTYSLSRRSPGEDRRSDRACTPGIRVFLRRFASLQDYFFRRLYSNAIQIEDLPLCSTSNIVPGQ